MSNDYMTVKLKWKCDEVCVCVHVLNCRLASLVTDSNLSLHDMTSIAQVKLQQIHLISSLYILTYTHFISPIHCHHLIANHYNPTS